MSRSTASDAPSKKAKLKHSENATSSRSDSHSSPVSLQLLNLYARLASSTSTPAEDLRVAATELVSFGPPAGLTASAANEADAKLLQSTQQLMQTCLTRTPGISVSHQSAATCSALSVWSSVSAHALSVLHSSTAPSNRHSHQHQSKFNDAYLLEITNSFTAELDRIRSEEDSLESNPSALSLLLDSFKVVAGMNQFTDAEKKLFLLQNQSQNSSKEEALKLFEAKKGRKKAPATLQPAPVEIAAVPAPKKSPALKAAATPAKPAKAGASSTVAQTPAPSKIVKSEAAAGSKSVPPKKKRTRED